MKKHLIAVTALCLTTSPAFAWFTPEGTWHNDVVTTSNSSSNSFSRSSARQSNNQQVNITGAAIPSNTSATYTIRNTPDVYAPSVEAGNMCAVGASGGAAWTGFGISFGTSWPQHDCEIRQQAALVWNMGDYDGAVALMCQITTYHQATEAAGHTCPDTPHAMTANQQADVVASPVNPKQTAPIAQNLDLCAARPGWTKAEVVAYETKRGEHCQ